MRGGHAAPRGFLRSRRPAPSVSGTWPPFWTPASRTVALRPDRAPADLSRLTRIARPMPHRTVADREAVAAGLRARRDLTAQKDIPTRVLPALRGWEPQDAPARPARAPFVADWRDLARFRDTCRTVGWSAAMRRDGAS